MDRRSGEGAQPELQPLDSAAGEATSSSASRVDKPAQHVHSWPRLKESTWPSARFLFQTEVHVYAFAVAANVLISFFPFLVAMISLCRSVLHWRAAVDIILTTLNDYFPEGFGVNFRSYLLTAASHKFNWLSMFLLLFTANGIFVPLEVAFNRIWHVKENRSFLRNQVVSLGLIFGCGVLILANVSITTINAQFLRTRFGAGMWSSEWQSFTLRLVALPLTALNLFVVYWVLPNIKIPIRRVLPASFFVAVLLEILKYLNVWTWPWLRAKLMVETPPFVQSISIILWSFVATLVILAGAEWSARVQVDQISRSES
jgi:membrane protein